MRIVITDTGNFWNYDNPLLEPFRDIVLVVCLQGREATEKYQCFVSPYHFVGLGGIGWGTDDQRLHALASVAEKLYAELDYHDRIVFLTDNEPSTLYPYYVLKNLKKYNSFHLVAMPPFRFEGRRRISVYYRMLSDLSALDSILYYDSDRVLEAVGGKGTMKDVFGYMREELGGLMPRFLNGIYKMRKKPCFFDFASLSYIPMENGFNNINLTKKEKLDKEVKFSVQRRYMTLGIVRPYAYPEEIEEVKKEVEKPVARLDGKKICNLLREQRIRLAEANHISFHSRECPSIGPCAGTCEKCDMELEYLRKQLEKIPEAQRIYPQFDPGEEAAP